MKSTVQTPKTNLRNPSLLALLILVSLQYFHFILYTKAMKDFTPYSCDRISHAFKSAPKQWSRVLAVKLVSPYLKF